MSTLNTSDGLVIKFKEGAPVQRLRFEDIDAMVNYLMDVNGYIEYALGRDIMLCGVDLGQFSQIKNLFEKRLNKIPTNVNIYHNEKCPSGTVNYKKYYVINLPWFLDKVNVLER